MARPVTDLQRTVAPFTVKSRGTRNRMDFCRGIADLAQAARDGTPPKLTARWSLHVNELVLAMQSPAQYGAVREIKSSFEPFAPMTWAE